MIFNYMLPSINRLTKKKDFDLVFKKGGSIKDDFLICKTLYNHLPAARFGFIVSKKVSGKATVRNTIKRRLRKALFERLKEIKKSMDVVIITLPGTDKKEFSQIQEAVGGCFKKAKLI